MLLMPAVAIVLLIAGGTHLMMERRPKSRAAVLFASLHSLRHYCEFRSPRAGKMDARPQLFTGSLAGGNLRR